MASRSFASAATLAAFVSGASAGCKCKFQDHVLPEELYNGSYPLQAPGSHKDDVAKGRYGTMCAAWDALPGTPWHEEYCKGEEALTNNSWCRAPWCYVNADCEHAEPTAVFNGSDTAFYSYEVCGAPDCFTSTEDGSVPDGCPYGSVHADTCACIYADDVLPAEVLAENTTYENYRGIEYYGTACGAWDQQPDTPFFGFCPEDSDWCSSEFNWCQAPWCYVDAASCDKENAESSVWPDHHYSYETCGAVNCQAQPDDEACPWDGSSNGWYTAVACQTMGTTQEEVGDDDDDDEDNKAASALALSSVITASVIMLMP